jgi:hypothetical protein
MNPPGRQVLEEPQHDAGVHLEQLGEVVGRRHAAVAQEAEDDHARGGERRRQAIDVAKSGRWRESERKVEKANRRGALPAMALRRHRKRKLYTLRESFW